MLIRDLQQLVTSQNQEGIATFLDFAKAYDRVNRQYLFRVLERQGFGPRFLAWIRLLYGDARCSLMLNGWAQDPLVPTRGVKQGDPLSPFLFALSLEPLGNLLRADRDLGVRVDAGLSIPAAFFADDTVLFSTTGNDLGEQIRLVDVYCAGSGAQLNHSKSVIMSLNNRHAAPQFVPMRSLLQGETVRYLGIPFGNFDTSTILATQLDTKVITRLRLWKGRARTLLGRRLIVQTLVLSLLWYATSTVHIPVRFINSWQGMVNRFVLYNRVGEDAKGIHIVQKGLAVRPSDEDGIGVPVIATNIRRQHFLLLQQALHALSDHRRHEDVVWYRPLHVMLSLRYGRYSRQWSSDFLYQDPPRPPAWRANMLPLWWRKVIRDWKKIKWPTRTSLRTSRIQALQFALFSPIWWNTSSVFHVRTTGGESQQPLPLGSGTIKFRRLCLTLAALNKCCFADFLDNPRQWPTATSFFFTMIYTAVLPKLGSRLRAHDIFQLYHQLSEVFRRVLPHHEAGGLPVVSQPTFPPCYGISVRGDVIEDQRTRFFPNLRSQDWIAVLQPVTPLEQHPMLHLGCPARLLHHTLSRIIWLRRCLMPVVHDVLLRLCFENLTVGSRLYFLRSLNPTIQLCVRPSCDAIETVQHCFLECPSLTKMWDQLWIPWSAVFNAPVSWNLLLFPGPRDLRDVWRRQQEVVLLIWRIFTAIVFHASWRLRNDIHFRAAQADSPNIPSLLLSFRRHCQLVFKHADEFQIDGEEIAMVLRRLNFDDPTTIPEYSSGQRIWIPQA